MTGAANVYGFGFETSDGRFVSARFTTKVRGDSSRSMGSGITKVTSWSQTYGVGELFVAAYRLVDGRLEGEFVTTTTGGERGREVLARAP